MSGVTTQGGFLHRNAGVRFRGPIFETTPDEAAWVTKYLVSYQARHQKRDARQRFTRERNLVFRATAQDQQVSLVCHGANP